MREYLHIEQLAELTPWSESAIRTMMSRGLFKEGVHFFKPQGHRGRTIFKWSAVVSYIECQVRGAPNDDVPIEFAHGSVIDFDEATKEICRLHD